MGDFLRKCRAAADKALDRSFINNAANIVMVLVALLLLISLLMAPAVLVALALLGLFIWAILC